MVGFSCLRSAARSTQTAPVAPTGRGQTERMLRDLAFVLHLTDKVKRQMTTPKKDDELVLAGAGHDGV